MFPLRALSLVMLTVTFTLGCTPEDEKKTLTANVSFEFTTLTEAALRGPRLSQAKGASLAESPNRSFTPESFLFPIVAVDELLSTATTGLSLAETGGTYRCASTESEECLVDFADPEQVAALNKKMKFSPTATSSDPNAIIDQFDKLEIAACSESTSLATYKVKGSALINGTTYYTTSKTAEVLTTNAADYDYVTLTTPQCSLNWKLPKTVQLKSGDDVTISLFMSLDDLAFAKLIGASEGGVCQRNSDNSRALCLGDVFPVAYVGTVSPNVETYAVAIGTEGVKAKLSLVVDANGVDVYGGYFRPYFDGTSEGFTNTGGGLGQISSSSDQTLKIQGYDSMAKSYEVFGAFQRADHSGTMVISSGTSTVDYSYTAVKL